MTASCWAIFRPLLTAATGEAGREEDMRARKIRCRTRQKKSTAMRQEVRGAAGIIASHSTANFAGDIRRGKDNHALLVALDPVRREAAIIPGYGLESFLKTETLDHLLELAGPAWESGRWAEGILGVLDGLDLLLESIAIPEEAGELGEF